MKQLPIYIILLLIIGLAGCQSDFDELKDTQQRHIVFSFDTGGLHSNFLKQVGSTYALSASETIPADFRLRISVYGYDESENLIYSNTILSEDMACAPLKVRHLWRDRSYRFVFVADIVKYDPFVDYYETWFQLGTKQWSDFYIFCDARQKEQALNSMATAAVIVTPDNQDVDVRFESITYNGYCVFNNLSGIDRLSGYVMYVSNLNFKTRAWRTRTSSFYSFDERAPKETTIIKPVSLCYADSIITVKLRRVMMSSTDSTFISIPNMDRRPFVATFDCRNLTLENCTFY